MTMSDVEELAAVSRAIGRNTAYVQGGGGNTSLKTGDRVMHIKASGIGLASVTAGEGFVALDWRALRQSLDACETEADYAQALRDARLDPAETRRASIETGMHALLGPCVLHSHSVWANLLTCADGGEQQARRLLPDAVWVPYATPGLPLTRQVAALLCDRPDPSLLLLENHGLVVTGPDVASAGALHDKVNLHLRTHFGLDAAAYPGTAGTEIAEDRLLFPDQAIYLADPALARSVAAEETRQAFRFLLATMPGLGLVPRFLGDAEFTELVGLDAEKYRRKVAQS